jgi:hypothetical protein
METVRCDSADHGGGRRRAGIQVAAKLPRYCRGYESKRKCRHENRRATQCAQREYYWLLVALAELRLAHSRQCLAPVPSITRRRLATVTAMATAIEHLTGAHLVTRYKAETAHLTEGRLVAEGARLMAAHPVTRYRAETARPTEVPLVRATAITERRFPCNRAHIKEAPAVAPEASGCLRVLI